MRRHIPLAICAFVVLLFLAAPGAGAVPPLPVTFWGPVYIDGNPAPLDTPVVAWVGGASYPATRVMSGTLPAYVVNVGGDDTWDPGAGDPVEEGMDITFEIGDLVADQVVVWQHGDNHPNYELTAAHEYSLYDFDQDWRITVADIQSVAALWGCSIGEPCYDEAYDLDKDDDVDIVDIMMVASRWGCELGDACYYGAPTLFSAGSGESKPAEDPIVVRLEPSGLWVEPGEVFTVTVQIDEVVNLGAYETVLGFDPALLQLEDVSPGEWLRSTGRMMAVLAPRVNPELGTVAFNAFTFGAQPGPDGSGVLATVAFSTKGSGLSLLDLTDVQVVDTLGQVQAISVEGGRVTVGAPDRIFLPFQAVGSAGQPLKSVAPSEPQFVRGSLRVYLPVLVK